MTAAANGYVAEGVESVAMVDADAGTLPGAPPRRTMAADRPAPRQTDWQIPGPRE